MGLAHAEIAHRLERLRERLVDDERGQGTVEYIGLILLLAGVMAVVVKTQNATNIGDTIVEQVEGAIAKVTGGSSGKK
jgi:Flp pilus assembly pilin Flp